MARLVLLKCAMLEHTVPCLADIYEDRSALEQIVLQPDKSCQRSCFRVFEAISRGVRAINHIRD